MHADPIHQWSWSKLRADPFVYGGRLAALAIMIYLPMVFLLDDDHVADEIVRAISLLVFLAAALLIGYGLVQRFRAGYAGRAD